MGDEARAYVITLNSIPFAICENEDMLRTVAAATVKTLHGPLSSPPTIEIAHSSTGMSLLICTAGSSTHTFFVYKVPKF